MILTFLTKNTLYFKTDFGNEQLHISKHHLFKKIREIQNPQARNQILMVFFAFFLFSSSLIFIKKNSIKMCTEGTRNGRGDYE